MKTKNILQLLCFYLFLSCSLFGATIPNGYRAMPEYYMLCHPIGGRQWHIYKYANEWTKGMYSNNHVQFHFTRVAGSWRDYLTASNTYEDCLLKQGYECLESYSTSPRTHSNISPLILWQSHNFLNEEIPYWVCVNNCSTDNVEEKIPFVEGEWFNPEGCHSGFFRLYMFPTKDEKSTYYLYIEIEALYITLATYKNGPLYEKHKKIFNDIFSFVRPRK